MADAAPERSDVHCTECGKSFVVEIDLRIEGNHVFECPYCKHHHFRVVKDKKVTEERWSQNLPTTEVDSKSVWAIDSQPHYGSTVSAFLREKWLDRLSKQ